jgi:hypothetical protein
MRFNFHQHPLAERAMMCPDPIIGVADGSYCANSRKNNEATLLMRHQPIHIMNTPNCPFYGFRWPERTTHLFLVSGNECALDFTENGPCRMESQGCKPDVRRCETAANAKAFLTLVADRILFIDKGRSDISQRVADRKSN